LIDLDCTHGMVLFSGESQVVKPKEKCKILIQTSHLIILHPLKVVVHLIGMERKSRAVTQIAQRLRRMTKFSIEMIGKVHLIDPSAVKRMITKKRKMEGNQYRRNPVGKGSRLSKGMEKWIAATACTEVTITQSELATRFDDAPCIPSPHAQ
jgi:hypothetical protein